MKHSYILLSIFVIMVSNIFCMHKKYETFSDKEKNLFDASMLLQGTSKDGFLDTKKVNFVTHILEVIKQRYVHLHSIHTYPIFDITFGIYDKCTDEEIMLKLSSVIKKYDARLDKKDEVKLAGDKIKFFTINFPYTIDCKTMNSIFKEQLRNMFSRTEIFFYNKVSSSGTQYDTSSPDIILGETEQDLQFTFVKENESEHDKIWCPIYQIKYNKQSGQIRYNNLSDMI